MNVFLASLRRLKLESLKRLKHQVIHNKDPPLYHCDHAGCDFKTKRPESLNKHKLIHNKNAPLYHCDHPVCDYKTKRSYNLKAYIYPKK